MKKLIALSLVFSLFVLAGCTSDEYLSLDDAKKEALKQLNGDVVDYTSDLESDKPSYTFDIVVDGVRHEVVIDAMDGSLISHALDDNLDLENEIKEDNQMDGTVTEEEAKKTAMDRIGSGDVKEIQLESTEDGKVYVIEIFDNTKEYIVYVDAINNTVLDVEEHIID